MDYLRELYKDYGDDTDPLQVLGRGTKVTLLDTKGIVSGSFTDTDIYRTNSSSRCLAPVDVLIHVLRGFEDKDLTHIEETVDPLRDYKILNREMKAQVFETNFLVFYLMMIE